MRTILKWLGIVLGSMVLLCSLAIGMLYATSEYQ